MSELKFKNFNPFREVFFEEGVKKKSFLKKSFWGKLKVTFCIFFGDFSTSPANNNSSKLNEAKWHLGIITLLLLPLALPFLLLSPLFALFVFPPAVVVLVILGAALALVALALAAVIAIVCFALTLACLPFLAIIHAIWGPKPETLETPARRSFLFDPLTWTMFAILVVGISLLIQGVNPIVFASAAAPLMVMQTVFAAMAGLAVFVLLVYGTYRLGRLAYSYFNEVPYQPNAIGNYLYEHWRWMRQNPVLAGVIWTIGVVGFLAAILLAVDYFFLGGMISGALMAPIFNFMSQGFLSSFQSVAGLPGLEFLGSLSEATCLLVSQIVSAVTFIASAFVIPYTAMRLFENIVPLKVDWVIVHGETVLLMEENEPQLELSLNIFASSQPGPLFEELKEASSEDEKTSSYACCVPGYNR